MGCAFYLTLALTAHFDTSYDNSIHPAMNFDCEKVIFGAYYNSISDLSLYAGRNTKISENISIDTGVVTGYKDPILPFARVNYKNFFIAPSDDGGGVFGIEIPIGGK